MEPLEETRALPRPAVRQAGGTIAGRYRLVSLLGRGGMGEVWRAHDPQLQRDVAVKLVAPGHFDTEGRARLLREARIAASLNHPHVVAVFDAGEDAEQPFLVMELVDGRNLRERPPRSEAGTRLVAQQVLEALSHAHTLGVVHRDLKPENLLATGELELPRVKLADLGVARTTHTDSGSAFGVVVGTANYLSPEQAVGGDIDGRADLYALGVVLYELLAGRLPFVGEDALAVISQHVHAPPPPLRTFRPDVPAALERFVLKLLAKTPELRFATAAEALEALERLDDASATEAGRVGDGALLDHLVRGRMVGRAAEFQRLRDVWRTVLAGRAQLALLSGEPGVGKTRLARELIVAARVDGAPVLSGGCYEFEATTPYLPFVEALSAWARGRPAEVLRAALGDAASELARLVPEVDARLGPFPAGPALAPHEDRLRLFDAVARFFRALSGSRGLLVMLDDLQWADTGTLALLRYLLRQLREERVLFLAGYREVELDRAHPLAASLVEWNRERIATRIALGRLERVDTDALLATLLGQETVSPEFGELIHHETEGNPFFIEEVVKSLIDQGEIYREGGEWQRRDISELAVPQSVKAAIGRRLDRLSAGCTEALHLAAVLGKVFTFDDLAACTERGEDALLDALDEASAAQLVASRERDNWAFTHDKIREVLYEEQNPVRRRRSHQRIGEAIEVRSPARVEDLAFHFLHSGDLERAYRWSTAAGDRAQQVFALDEAAKYRERARECAEGLGDPVRTLEALRALAAVHALRGDPAAALRACEQALPLCGTPAERAEVNARAGEVLVRVGRSEGAAYLEAALRELDPATQPRELALVKANMARLHHYRMEHRRAIELLEEALVVPGVAGTPWIEEHVFPYLAGAYQHLGDFVESMRWAQRCLDGGRARQQPGFESIGHEFLGEDLAALGRFAEALEHGQEDLRIGQRMGSLDRAAWGGWVVMWSRGLLGDLVPAIEHGERARDVAVQIGESRLICILAQELPSMLWAVGCEAEAEALLVDAQARAEKLGHAITRALVSLGRAIFELRRGNDDAARTAALAAISMREGGENVIALEACLYVAAMAEARSDRLEEAATHAAAALAFSERGGLAYGRGLAHTALATVAAARGRHDQALEHFAHALVEQQRTGARLEQSRIHVARAVSLEATGDLVTARAARAQALQLFEACGATVEAARLRTA